MKHQAKTKVVKMVKRLSEFSLIEKYFAPLSSSGAFGLKDDAALLQIPKNKTLVVTNDAIAEGVHFLKGTDPKRIAQKAIRTNLSDLAAKGATPFAFSLALGLPSDWDNDWIKAFAKGLKADCKAFGISLCGGDTFRVSPDKSGAVISITAYGHIDKKDYASRLGAKSGHALYVTGAIGDGVLGLTLATDKSNDKLQKPNAAQKYLIDRYEIPQPRIEMIKLVAKYASASMDISDGFVGDLEKLCSASHVAANINLMDIPISKQARAQLKTQKVTPIVAVTSLITGGDDHELLIVIPKSKVNSFETESKKLNFPITFLGNFKKENASFKGVNILGEDGEPIILAHRSYTHY